MPSYLELAEAFAIFTRCDPDGADVSAGHDEMWAGPDPSKVSAEDKARLEVLGWHDYGDGNGFHTFI